MYKNHKWKNEALQPCLCKCEATSQSFYDTGLVDIWTHKDRGSNSQDLPWLKSDSIPALRMRKGHKIPPLTKKLFAVESFWEWEMSLRASENEKYQPHSMAGTMPESSWSTQSELYLCVCVCVCFDFFVLSFCLFWFLFLDCFFPFWIQKKNM